MIASITLACIISVRNVLTVNWPFKIRPTVGSTITQVLSYPRKLKPIYEPEGKQHPLWFLLYLLGCEVSSWLEVNAVC